MSSSTHQIKVKANDQTAGAFASIQKRAQAAGINIRRMLGGAIAAAGAYLGVRAFMAGADELGKLSDVAMKASTSVDELTSAATAFSVLGINANAEQIATAFTKMAQSTGRTGMAGFYKTVEELGKISDVTERSQKTMKVFGKAGLEFMPLINGAKQGSEALQSVIDAMPKIPQAAADAGDKLADAKVIGTAGFKKLWSEAIASVVDNIDNKFEGGIRRAALNGVAYFEYFTKMAWAEVVTQFSKIGLYFQGFNNNLLTVATSFGSALLGSMKAVVDELKNLTQKATDSFSQSIGKKMYDWLNESLGKDNANKFKHFLDEAGISDFVFGRNVENWRPPKPKEIKYDDTFSNIMKGIKDSFKKNITDKVDWLGVGALEEEHEKYKDKLVKALDEALAKNKKAVESMGQAAVSTGDRQAEEKTSLASKSKIDNKLILGGSNEATKLALLGPQTQQELKKQTNILKEIRDATKQTATNTDDIGDGYDDLTELN